MVMMFIATFNNISFLSWQFYWNEITLYVKKNFHDVLCTEIQHIDSAIKKNSSVSLLVVLVGFVLFIFLFFCVFLFCLSSLFVLFPWLPGFFLDCPYLIAPSVFLYLKSICVAFHYQMKSAIIKQNHCILMYAHLGICGIKFLMHTFCFVFLLINFIVLCL